MKPESVVPVKPESYSFKLEKIFSLVKRYQSKQRSKIETAEDKAQAAYINRPCHDALSLVDCLNAKIFATKRPLRTRQRRLRTIEIWDSSIAHYNYTFGLLST